MRARGGGRATRAARQRWQKRQEGESVRCVAVAAHGSHKQLMVRNEQSAVEGGGGVRGTGGDVRPETLNEPENQNNTEPVQYERTE